MKFIINILFASCFIALFVGCDNTNSRVKSDLDQQKEEYIDHVSISKYFEGAETGTHYFYFPNDGRVFILERKNGKYQWTNLKGLQTYLENNLLYGWVVYTTVYETQETPGDFGILHSFLMKNNFKTQSLPFDPHPLAVATSQK